MVTIGNERYLRYIFLLAEGVLLVLRGIIRREVLRTGSALDAILTIPTNRRHLERNCHSQTQRLLLFPPNSTVNSDIDTWDISLLTLIIQKVFWSNLSRDERLRISCLQHSRDEYQRHPPEMSMEATDYNTRSTDLTTTLQDLASATDQQTRDKLTKIINDSNSAEFEVHTAIHRLQQLCEVTECMVEELQKKFGTTNAKLDDMKVSRLQEERESEQECLKHIEKGQEEFTLAVEEVLKNKKIFIHKAKHETAKGSLLQSGRMIDLSKKRDDLSTLFEDKESRIADTDTDPLKSLPDDEETKKSREEYDFGSQLRQSEQTIDLSKEVDDLSTFDKDSENSARKRKAIDQDIQTTTDSEHSAKKLKTIDQVFEDIKGDRKSLWENVRTVKKAQALINSGRLPDGDELSDLVHRFGRKSIIVGLACQSICKKIASVSPNCVHVFAAYTIENRDRLHFVVFLENESSSDLNLEYEILFRSCKRDKQSDHRNITTESEGEISAVEYVAIEKTVQSTSKQYMEKHKYLSVITARKILSESGENLCIVMYVHPCTDRYSSILHTEDPLPTAIQGYKVVVRNGVFKTAVNIADGHHENIRMGCKITSDITTQSGTLGGFIEHPEYGLCGFTCAHVLYNNEELMKLRKAKRIKRPRDDPCLVYQPSTDSEYIGRVVEATLIEGGENDSAGVDLAVFQIEDRHPIEGTFPLSSPNEKLKFATGKTWGRTRITRNSREVQKYGCKTGLTHGQIMFEAMSVKIIEFRSKDILKQGDPFFFNQYEVKNMTKDVCRKGDSGALVFMNDNANGLVCVGMVIGVIDQNDENSTNYPLHGVVTPITDILHELRIQTLKPFNEELTIAHIEKKLSENAQAARDERNISNDNLLSKIQEMHSQLQKSVEEQLKTHKSEVQAYLSETPRQQTPASDLKSD